MATSSPKYRQPKLTYFVKLKVPIFLNGKLHIHSNSICRVMQYLEADGRYTRMPTIKVKSDVTGELIALYKHEFAFCDERGEVNEEIDSIS